MILNQLITAARKDEEFLLGVLEPFARVKNFDSVASWFCLFLKEARDLAPHFELPASKKLAAAYVEVLKSNSFITAPLLRVLTNRLNVYFLNVPELLEQPRSEAHRPR